MLWLIRLDQHPKERPTQRFLDRRNSRYFRQDLNNHGAVPFKGSKSIAAHPISRSFKASLQDPKSSSDRFAVTLTPLLRLHKPFELESDRESIRQVFQTGISFCGLKLRLTFLNQL